MREKRKKEHKTVSQFLTWSMGSTELPSSKVRKTGGTAGFGENIRGQF